jgi:hypothetical protein
VSAQTNDDDDEEHLGEEDPADAGDCHDPPPQHWCRGVARIRGRRWVEEKDVTEDEQDSGDDTKGP